LGTPGNAHKRKNRSGCNIGFDEPIVVILRIGVPADRAERILERQRLQAFIQQARASIKKRSLI
jgi:hypothetical protein